MDVCQITPYALHSYTTHYLVPRCLYSSSFFDQTLYDYYRRKIAEILLYLNKCNIFWIVLFFRTFTRSVKCSALNSTAVIQSVKVLITPTWAAARQLRTNEHTLCSERRTPLYPDIVFFTVTSSRQFSPCSRDTVRYIYINKKELWNNYRRMCTSGMKSWKLMTEIRNGQLARTVTI